MNLSFFEWFANTCLLGILFILLSMLFPTLLVSTPNNRWITNHLSTLQLWLFHLITKQMIPLNKNGRKWALLLTSLMVLLFMINLLGLLPYTFTPNTQLSMNMALAFPLWLATLLTGLRNQRSVSLGHLLPEGKPTPLIPALIMIESTSLLIHPLALLIQLISTATTALLPIMPTISFLTAFILFLLTIPEVAVAMIQAYVFVLLLSLYLQENI
uniref:ATP synthase subunit a n=1 Tax=Henicophaps albifrons TaxID=444142 RepID=A7KF59_HENAL|nr:ATP synthase F0 subunit 6 [Henicophaps albifrons]